MAHCCLTSSGPGRGTAGQCGSTTPAAAPWVQFLWLLSERTPGRDACGFCYLCHDACRWVLRLLHGCQPSPPALLWYSDRRKHTLILGFPPGALGSSLSTPSSRCRMPICIYFPDRCLCASKILSNMTSSNLVEIAVMEDASAIFSLISFPVIPISSLNGIMNEFTGAFLLSFSLRGAAFWSMRQMIEMKGELTFTFILSTSSRIWLKVKIHS